jgi:hypothetical protein
VVAAVPAEVATVEATEEIAAVNRHKNVTADGMSQSVAIMIDDINKNYCAIGITFIFSVVQ